MPSHRLVCRVLVLDLLSLHQRDLEANPSMSFFHDPSMRGITLWLYDMRNNAEISIIENQVVQRYLIFLMLVGLPIRALY